MQCLHATTPCCTAAPPRSASAASAVAARTTSPPAASATRSPRAAADASMSAAHAPSAADAHAKVHHSTDWERVNVERSLLKPGRVIRDKRERAEMDLAALSQNSA